MPIPAPACPTHIGSAEGGEVITLRIVSTGEILWDVFGDREFLGGAPLNFSATAHRLGNSILLLTAVGADQRGTAALQEIRSLGLDAELIQTVNDRATGTAIVSIDSSGNASYVIERPAAFDCFRADNSQLARLQDFHPDWIYYGTLAQIDENTENFLRQLICTCSAARRFYDMNLRTGHWNLPLVQRLSGLATTLKLNEAEAELLFKLTHGPGEFSLEEFCRSWASSYGIETVCVTLGSRGCAVFAEDQLQTFEGVPVKVVDTVGAGDAFAAAFLHGFHLGWPMDRTASFANALGALVASRPGATPPWSIDECLQLMALNARRTNRNESAASWSLSPNSVFHE